MKLRRIHVVTHPEGLDRAIGRVREAGQIPRQRTGTFLVAAVCVEYVGKIGEQRIAAALFGEADGQGTYGLGWVRSTVAPTTDPSAPTP